MALSNLDQKLVDYRIIELSTKVAGEIIREVIAAHLASCPVSKQLNTKMAFAGGLAAAVGLMSMVVSILVYFSK
jgi:F0F1-type ATP synthase membrane subunit c/vacuolar-type H+-ATPase subunit K